MNYIETNRLILRGWLEKDLEKMVQINQDPQVMKFFPYCPNAIQTAEFIDKIKSHFKKYGYGLYCVELKETRDCIGFVGLNEVDFEAHFTPAMEIGWRLSSKYWNQGYATEAAKSVLELAFNKFNLSQIVSFTATINKPSIRVMEKIGMINDEKDNFQHPKLPKNHPLSLHVLYRISNNNNMG